MHSSSQKTDSLPPFSSFHHTRCVIHSYLPFIRRELLRELFNPCNHEKLVHNPLLKFSVHIKIDQIASVNAPA